MIPPLSSHAEFVKAVRPIAQALTHLADHGYSATVDGPNTQPPPAADSRAAAELGEQAEFAGVWDDVPIDTALTHISLLMHAGEDAMLTFSHLVPADRSPLYAFQPVVRFGIECFARAHWLARPDIGTRERVRRSLNERLASDYEMSRLPEALNREAGRHERLLAAASLGFEQTRKGKVPSLGSERPTITQLVKDLLGHDDIGQVTYAFTSAVSHGTIWGLAEVVRTDPDDTGPVVQATLVNSSSRINVAGVALAMAHIQAADTVFEYLGWPTTDWIKVKTYSQRVLRGLLSEGANRPSGGGTRPTDTA